MTSAFLQRFKSQWKFLGAVLAAQPVIWPVSESLVQFLQKRFQIDAGRESLIEALVVVPSAVIAIGLLVNLYTTVVYSRRPLSVIKSKVVIDLKTADGSLAETTRRQLLRAEQPDVCARYKVIAEHVGEIDRDSLEHTRIPQNPEDQMLDFGDSKRLTTIMRYPRPLPYSWLGQLFIPDAVFRHLVHLNDEEHLYSWLHRFVMLERSSVREVGEYARKKGWFNLIAQRYVSSNLQIIIKFHKDNPPIEFKAYILKSPTVEDVNFSRRTCETTGSQIYSVIFPSLRDETATVVWELSHEPDVANK